MSSELILIGGGGHCQSCIDVIEQEGSHQIHGILDVESRVGGEILGYNILGTDDSIADYVKQGKLFLITMGQIKSPHARINLFNKVKVAGGEFATIASPLAYVSQHAKVGEGTIIMHGAILNAGAQVGINGIINSGALVEHGVQIGNHCHISTRSVINGDVRIEDCVFVGSGAVIVEGTQILKDSFIKAQSLSR